MILDAGRTLTEQNKALTVRNAQLETQVAVDGRNERSRELEQAMADVQAENARLQVNMCALFILCTLLLALCSNEMFDDPSVSCVP